MLLHVEKADTFFKRLFGLTCRKSLPPYHGLLLSPCNSIHMLFMLFPIDAVFLDKNFTITKIVSNLKPWFGFAFSFHSFAVLELNAGEAERLHLSVGQSLHLEFI